MVSVVVETRFYSTSGEINMRSGPWRARFDFVFVRVRRSRD
jgi:hypothetical protein